MRTGTIGMVLGMTAVLCLPASPVYGMRKHFGRAADPATGAALPDAKIWVFSSGTENAATIFADAAGITLLKNPVQADDSGRYSFYAPNGMYRLQIRSPAGQLIYDIDDVPVVDPREPRIVVATEQQPALSLHTLGQWADVNLPLIMERRNEQNNLVGAAWRVLCQFTEKGWLLAYNYRRRGGAANPSDKVDELAFKDMPHVDFPEEPTLEMLGTNDADDGVLAWPGLTIFGGGAWTGGAHLTAMNVLLSKPQSRNAAGIAVRMDGPKGLAAGDVVALDPNGRNRVVITELRGAKLPFVVARTDGTNVFVVVRGLAWVKVDGPVEAGDILITSEKSGQVLTDNANADPAQAVGVAVTNATQGWAVARIQRVGKTTE